MYERVVVDPPPDANVGCVRQRSPEAVLDMRQRREAGARAVDIARAYGVSIRTAYRYLAHDSFAEVALDGWRATFAVREGSTPVRVTPWKRG